MKATAIKEPPAIKSQAGIGGRVDIIISQVLRWGVSGSLLLILIGSLLGFINNNDYGAHGGSAADLRRLLRADNPFTFSFQTFIHDLYHFKGQALIIAGLLLLIATPVARVAISIVAFAFERDWTYVAITGAVFILLILSLIAG